MHVVSVYLHYSKIIWLPWQHPWQIGEWGTDPSSACKAFWYGEMIVKIGPVHPEILDDVCRTTTWTCNAISITMFSAETTGPILTKILHVIVTLVLLLMHPYTLRIPFRFRMAWRQSRLVHQKRRFFDFDSLPWQRPLKNQKKLNEVSKSLHQPVYQSWNFAEDCSISVWATGSRMSTIKKI